MVVTLCGAANHERANLMGHIMLLLLGVFNAVTLGIPNNGLPFSKIVLHKELSNLF
jgi:hypothetical protein